jgi:precorrin-6B methylase 2
VCIIRRLAEHRGDPSLTSVSMRLYLLLAVFFAASVQAQEIHPDIHYVPTSDAVMEAMFRMAQPTADDVLYDLGSGDGRIVIAAARRFGLHGVGVEIDPALVKKANENARKAGVADRVEFVQADLFKTDLSPATIVTLYLSPSINLRLKSKLQEELRPGARVLSNRFEIKGWPPDDSQKAGGRRVYVWRIKS